MIDYVLRVGGGSARDALSALEQTLASGGTPDDDTAVEEVLDGISPWRSKCRYQWIK